MFLHNLWLQFPGYRALIDWGPKGCKLETHCWWIQCVGSLSTTLYSLFSNGSTQDIVQTSLKMLTMQWFFNTNTYLYNLKIYFHYCGKYFSKKHRKQLPVQVTYFTRNRRRVSQRNWNYCNVKLRRTYCFNPRRKNSCQLWRKEKMVCVFLYQNCMYTWLLFTRNTCDKHNCIEL